MANGKEQGGQSGNTSHRGLRGSKLLSLEVDATFQFVSTNKDK